MKPADRIRLIQQLAEQMSTMGYTDTDLILRQFGLPWQESWSGDSYGYAVAMLEQGTDEKLLALHELLFGFSGAPAGDSRPELWHDKPLGVFISHVTANKVYAAQLKTELERSGVGAFVAHEDIEPTKEWVDEIEKALASCDVLVALLSPGFKESRWTDQEVGYCHGRHVLILSVRQGLDPYGFISRYQALQGAVKTPPEIAREISSILLKHPKTAARAAEAMVAAFEDADSFAEAKEKVQRLQEVVSWTPELLRRIEQASESNYQIRQAWGVPRQVDAILEANGGGSSSAPTAPPDILDEDYDLPF